MTVINLQKLKNLYKAALKSAKIFYVGFKVCHPDVDFGDYLTLIWVGKGGNVTPPVGFPLITQKR